MSAKRWLFLTHRWLGVLLCAFFAMWFVSGVVMMYVGYPKLTEAERLQHLPVLEGAAGWLAPRDALAAAGVAGPLKDLRLAAASGGRAVYLATAADEAAGPRRGRPAAVVIDAASGERLPAADRDRALASAAAYAGAGVPLAHQGSIGEDAFTHSRALDAHRPLHVVQVGDAAGTRLYVSSRTGEVVRDATSAERGWNYAGAWIHWLYPFRGNLFDRWWADIVNGLSVAGIALTITGTVVGLMRWRFGRPYRSGARTPYPGALMRWHHVSGLLFAAVTLTWIFSGLMSMNPLRMFDSGAPALREAAMHEGRLQAEALGTAPAALLAAAGPGVRELRWVRSLGADRVLAQPAAGRPLVLDAAQARPASVDREALRAAAAALVGAPVVRTEWLTAYDTHYYARAAHTMTGGTDKPLPALRVVFGDAAGTWVHLDPHTGLVIGRSDTLRRTSRWLFAMLHSWDWLPLLERRPLWDAVLVALSLGGAALSLTGVVVGWRRLVRPLQPRRRQAAEHQHTPRNSEAAVPTSTLGRAGR
ncbi:PepSY-associated TM helix domain-containing protein [Aquincola sp. MAHUQ-54]|uniref:PepSY-associated TM helix domain-containing protein n=1 Tax=Aquincola agrisoli TaxID=3119538 RepID=A0AAW9PYE5_9BURK